MLSRQIGDSGMGPSFKTLERRHLRRPGLRATFYKWAVFQGKAP